MTDQLRDQQFNHPAFRLRELVGPVTDLAEIAKLLATDEFRAILDECDSELLRTNLISAFNGLISQAIALVDIESNVILKLQDLYNPDRPQVLVALLGQYFPNTHKRLWEYGTTDVYDKESTLMFISMEEGIKAFSNYVIISMFKSPAFRVTFSVVPYSIEP